MGEEFNTLIIFCGTRTDPAAKTESIGLQADALVPCFLLAIWTISSWPKTHTHHPDLVPSRQLIVTRQLPSTYRDWQKTRHPDTPPLSGQAHANSLNRRAVRFKIPCTIPWYPMRKQEFGNLPPRRPTLLPSTCFFAYHGFAKRDNYLEYERSKTSDIYRHIPTRGFDHVKSPLDTLDLWL